MDPDPFDQARRFVRQELPDALSAVLGGSTAAGHATPSSDLDIAVLVADGDETRRETVRFEGRLVEAFVHTWSGLREVFAADRAARRGTLQHMYASGLVLADPDGAARRARELAVAELRDGPEPLTAPAAESMRYGLTDALDDLTDATDDFDRLALAGVVLGHAAGLLCDHHRAWTGSGKWLPRRLAEAAPERGAALLRAHLRLCRSGDAAPLADAAHGILRLVGGPLREGYRRRWREVTGPRGDGG